MIETISEARNKLQTLAAAQSSRGRFLTVTLSTSRLDDWRQFAPTFVNSEFNRIVRETDLPRELVRSLEDDLRLVNDVIQYDVVPSTQGLALFGDGGSSLFERVELPLPLLNRLVVEPSPDVRPLVHVLSVMEPFIVAKVSRDESTLYMVNAWGVAAEDELAGPWLRGSESETGETAVRRYFASARQDALVEQHFKEVGASLAKLIESGGVRRVVVSALRDVASNFQHALPQATAARIVAEIPFDPAQSVGQMVMSARSAVAEAQARELEQLAERIRDNVGAAGRGAAGFDDVLGTLQRGQVQTLLVDRSYRPRGWRCCACPWMALTPISTCPVCSGEVVPVEDAGAELIRRAVLQDAQIEVCENPPALDEMGGVAALLRYA